MQFWHRRRAKKPIARVRAWANNKESKLLGFAGYKVGMATVIATDNGPNSMTKGQEIAIPVTILECPSLKIASIIFYKNKNILSSVMSQKLDKELSKKISLPKKVNKKIEDMKDFDDIELLVYTQPKLTTIGKKKPEMFQIAIGGSVEEKLAFAKENLGKEINVQDVFNDGQTTDIHAITTGKGYQGPVKRHGVAILRRKTEKTKRGVGSLGDWIHKSLWKVAHAGQMGFHQRIEHNKQIIKIGDNPEEINSKSGFKRYGIIKNNFILVKGSIAGPVKRTIIFTQSIRPNKKIHTQAPDISEIIR